MRKLNHYYFYIYAPITIVVLGIILFFNPIMNTIRGNPHPHINYLIFLLIPAGMAMMARQIHRMNSECELITRFYLNNREQKISNEQLLQGFGDKRGDSFPVLEIVSECYGAAVSSVQLAAVEAELERFQSKQNRRMNAPQFLGGMMVGLGLLGTFIGLLGALDEIGKLIGSFSTINSADPSAAIRGLVEHLTAPMQAMGVAFSASLFGVLGSLIMGVLLVSVKNCSAELVSILRSRVAIMVDFGTGEIDDKKLDQLNQALAKVSEQSPVLALLVQSLAASEGRTRDLISAMLNLTSKVEMQEAKSMSLLAQMEKSYASDSLVAQGLQAMTQALPVITEEMKNQVKDSQKIGLTLSALGETQRQQVEMMSTHLMRVEGQQKQSEVMVSRLMEVVQLQMKEMIASQNGYHDAQRASHHVTAAETVSIMQELVITQRDAAGEAAMRQRTANDQLVKSLGDVIKALDVQMQLMSQSNNRLELLLMRPTN